MILPRNIKHIASKLVLKRYREGVTLGKARRDEWSPFLLSNVFNLPCSVYFDNADHEAQMVNDTCAEICGFESTFDAIGRSVYDFSTKESANRSVMNQKEILTTQKTKIIEDMLIRKDDVPISFLGISFPWYADDKLIGVFGCSIVLNTHSMAQSLNGLYQLGLLSHQPLTEAHNLPGYFTAREQQCIHHIMDAKSPKVIAKILGLSYRTVEHYIANIKSKLGVSTNTELMAKLADYSRR